ncbi:DNA starvation/stationary phase protection protein [Sphingomonas sp. MAH-20]|uniref:DNA starvation/stationary phase protection protein n=1 Tax=Sphingomonas horti TaxID=2682842 RepID=A0A6I4IZX5_9SPHN|nr:MULTISPECIES: DNA starvation/stationary phase protection protein [Sphingomonas]MBA2920680.1 DNA starvation/stationary phase protection protein [Sphingomonas sp. CGMCC 1.13658]MVO77616.1 DNA starvation/stationary phase protection protein [Sphingomonas horti]
MASAPTDLKTPTDLSSNETKSAADALNGLLADAFALFLKTKNFHWHVSGPHFRDYHLMLDEQAAEIIGITDAIAERVRKIGNTTLRSIGDIARRQTLIDNDREYVAPAAMLAELRDDNSKLVQRIREAREAAEAAGDTATSSMADDWIDQAEKRAWFLFEASRNA